MCNNNDHNSVGSHLLLQRSRCRWPGIQETWIWAAWSCQLIMFPSSGQSGQLPGQPAGKDRPWMACTHYLWSELDNKNPKGKMRKESRQTTKYQSFIFVIGTLISPQSIDFYPDYSYETLHKPPIYNVDTEVVVILQLRFVTIPWSLFRDFPVWTSVVKPLCRVSWCGFHSIWRSACVNPL